MRFEILGDQAVMAYADGEVQAACFANAVRIALLPWVVDVVQAYATVAVFLDLRAIDVLQARIHLSELVTTSPSTRTAGRRHVIPCCYESGLDFERIREHTGLDRDAVISLHMGSIYTVYAIGFCPGFPYLGYLPRKLSGVPRLESPRLKVEAGSVGLTGRQTGIYTLDRPGGWNIIGQTPLELVKVEDEYFPLRTGDEVSFTRIDEREFRRLRGQRLKVEA